MRKILLTTYRSFLCSALFRQASQHTNFLNPQLLLNYLIPSLRRLSPCFAVSISNAIPPEPFCSSIFMLNNQHRIRLARWWGILARGNKRPSHQCTVSVNSGASVNRRQELMLRTFRGFPRKLTWYNSKFVWIQMYAFPRTLSSNSQVHAWTVASHMQVSFWFLLLKICPGW